MIYGPIIFLRSISDLIVLRSIVREFLTNLNFMMSQKDQNSNLSVFISGVPYTASDDDVREFFKDVGTIT